MAPEPATRRMHARGCVRVVRARGCVRVGAGSCLVEAVGNDQSRHAEDGRPRRTRVRNAPPKAHRRKATWSGRVSAA